MNSYKFIFLCILLFLLNGQNWIRFTAISVYIELKVTSLVLCLLWINSCECSLSQSSVLLDNPAELVCMSARYALCAESGFVRHAMALEEKARDKQHTDVAPKTSSDLERQNFCLIKYSGGGGGGTCLEV